MFKQKEPKTLVKQLAFSSLFHLLHHSLGLSFDLSCSHHPVTSIQWYIDTSSLLVHDDAAVVLNMMLSAFS